MFTTKFPLCDLRNLRASQPEKAKERAADLRLESQCFIGTINQPVGPRSTEPNFGVFISALACRSSPEFTPKQIIKVARDNREAVLRSLFLSPYSGR
jgi:hypothetical protein